MTPGIGSLGGHICALERQDETAVDRFGAPDPDQYLSLATNVACRLSRVMQGGERFGGPVAGGAVNVTHMLYIAQGAVAGITIRESDRVVEVTDPAGVALASTLDIKQARAVSKRGGFVNHYELSCEELRDGDYS